MKRSRFNEEQIIAILKEQEAGMATAEVSGHGYDQSTAKGGGGSRSRSQGLHQSDRFLRRGQPCAISGESGEAGRTLRIGVQ